MPNVVVGARTDVGRHRSLNEDALLIGTRVWVVADGMGGHAAGDVASRLAVQSLRELDEAGELSPASVVAQVAARQRGRGRLRPTSIRRPAAWAPR